MDPSRFRRPGRQKQGQIQKPNLGNSRPVAEVVSWRPDIVPRPGGLAVQHSMRQQPQKTTLTEVKPAPKPNNHFEQVLNNTPSAAVLARRVPIDMVLPGQDSPHRVINSQNWGKAKRVAFRGVALGFVLILIISGAIFSQTYLKLQKVFKGGSATVAALSEEVKPELLKGEGRGRVNLLLLGRGGGTHSAPDLTDTLMIASIDPLNHTTTLLSVPRDFWVSVPNHGVMKLNAAWQTGEFEYLNRISPGSNDPKAINAGFYKIDQTLKEVTGLDIDYHILVDFKAFKQAVDTVGGVDVNVPTDLIDPTMAWENQHNPVLAKAGLQTFDGQHALNYVRSRETSSDFARSERQRSVLLALKGKVVNLGTLSNPLKISNLLNAFGDNVKTDLSLSNANRLYKIMKQVGDSSTTSISLVDGDNKLVTTSSINGQSVVIPKTGLYKYDEIKAFIRGKLQDPYIMKEKAKILILNGTTVPGKAAAKADELKSYGYNVIATANTPDSNWIRTTLIDLTHRNKFTKNYLEQRFDQKAATELNDKTIPTNGADFVIIIGSDETNFSENTAY